MDNNIKYDSSTPIPQNLLHQQPIPTSMGGSKKKIPLIPLLFISLTLVGVIVGMVMMNTKRSVKTRASGNGVALSLLPATQEASVGQEFTEEIIINTKDQTVSGAELYLTYDTTKVQAIDIKEGTFLPVVLTKGTIKNGTVSITLGCQPSSPQKGSGVLASVKFKLLANTPANITFTDATLVTAIDNKTDNVVDTKVGATITISSAPTTAPTVAPTIGVGLTPTLNPTIQPTISQLEPTSAQLDVAPTLASTLAPTSPVQAAAPTIAPTAKPTQIPEVIPTLNSAATAPYSNPTRIPTSAPALLASNNTIISPTQFLGDQNNETFNPTVAPTKPPTPTKSQLEKIERLPTTGWFEASAFLFVISAVTIVASLLL